MNEFKDMKIKEIIRICENTENCEDCIFFMPNILECIFNKVPETWRNYSQSLSMEDNKND